MRELSAKPEAKDMKLVPTTRRMDGRALVVAITMNGNVSKRHSDTRKATPWKHSKVAACS